MINTLLVNDHFLKFTFDYSDDIFQPFLVVPEKLINGPFAIKHKCTIHFMPISFQGSHTLQPILVFCLPSAIEKRHPCGAAPGH